MTKTVSVREAVDEDKRSVWEWWNDPVTRQMMKKNDPVPWEEHCKWFEGVLNDDKRILCMGFVDGERIGVIRFTHQFDEVYEVSINLNPDFRGQGYAAKFLSNSVAFLQTIRSPTKLVAGCKKKNQPSMKTFQRAGFSFHEIDGVYPALQPFDSENEMFCDLDVSTLRSECAA